MGVEIQQARLQRKAEVKKDICNTLMLWLGKKQIFLNGRLIWISNQIFLLNKTNTSECLLLKGVMGRRFNWQFGILFPDSPESLFKSGATLYVDLLLKTFFKPLKNFNLEAKYFDSSQFFAFLIPKPTRLCGKNARYHCSSGNSWHVFFPVSAIQLQ